MRGGTRNAAGQRQTLPPTAHPHRKHSICVTQQRPPATVPHPSRLTACHRPTCGARLMRRVLTGACIRSTAALLAACLSLPPAAAARKPPGGGRPRFARGRVCGRGGRSCPQLGKAALRAGACLWQGGRSRPRLGTASLRARPALRQGGHPTAAASPHCAAPSVCQPLHRSTQPVKFWACCSSSAQVRPMALAPLPQAG